MYMDFRTRRDVFSVASEPISRGDRSTDSKISSRVFVEQFANMEQGERVAWVQIQMTADSITTSGLPAQRMRLKTLKAEVEDFLTRSFCHANLQECDIVTQNKQLTQILLNEYPSMQASIAALEAQRFCHWKILHP